jgi:hypothetical protein
MSTILQFLERLSSRDAVARPVIPTPAAHARLERRLRQTLTRVHRLSAAEASLLDDLLALFQCDTEHT